MLRWLVPILVVIVAVVVQVFRPVPRPSLQTTVPPTVQVPGPAPTMPWPSTGQAAVAVAGGGVIARFGPDQAQPIASLAKMMTALVVLQDRPLQPGSNGPTLVVQPADVQTYARELKGGQSVVRVVAGERLDERQLLTGLLLPSGNNYAALLARLDAGSVATFVSRMNAEAAKLGLKHTHYADVSGVNAATVSTASDQLTVAEAAMAIATFRNIVKLPQANLPVVGRVYNVNYFLGHPPGIIGVKTGTTSASGGCYVSAAYKRVGGQQVLVLAAVLGQGTVQPLMAALRAGQRLLTAAGGVLTQVPVLKAHQEVARLSAPGMAAEPLLAPRAVSVVGWPGLKGSVQVVPAPLNRALAAGARVATLDVTIGSLHSSMPLVTARAVPSPSLAWRLTRPPFGQRG